MRKIFLALCASAVLLSISCAETSSARHRFDAPTISTTMACDSVAIREAAVPANPQAQTYVQQYNYQAVATADNDRQKPETFGEIVLEAVQICIAVISILSLIFLFYAGVIVIIDRFYDIIYRS